jgi:hypothetical protein
MVAEQSTITGKTRHAACSIVFPVLPHPDMQAALFAAGLGDVIRKIYLTRSYQILSETKEPVKVLCASHNPFASEIFRFHRNASNFIIYELGHKYDEFLRKGLRALELDKAICEFAGVKWEDLITGRGAGYVPQFDAPDTIDSTGHVIFQPFSGSLVSRTFSEKTVEQVAGVLRQFPCKVYLITRSFVRIGVSGRLAHAEENARKFEGGNITVLDHLSVPATLNLVKSCSAFVGSWSSLQQAAWFENKPVGVVYPNDWCDVVNRSDYAFGLERPDCFHTNFNSLDPEKLKTWLAQWVPTPMSDARSRPATP